MIAFFSLLSETIQSIRLALYGKDRLDMQHALKYMVANGCVMHRNLKGRGNG